MWLAKTAWSVNQRELAAELYAEAENLSVEPIQKQAARVMRQFSKSVLDGTISTSVSAAVDRAALPVTRQRAHSSRAAQQPVL